VSLTRTQLLNAMRCNETIFDSVLDGAKPKLRSIGLRIDESSDAPDAVTFRLIALSDHF